MAGRARHPARLHADAHTVEYRPLPELPGDRHRCVARASAIPQAIRGLIASACGGILARGNGASPAAGQHRGARRHLPPGCALLAGGERCRQLVVGTPWPTAFAFDPDGRIVYGNRFTGQIRIFDPATGGDTLFFALPDVATAGEQGLLGLAIHPSYPARPYVFAYYTRTVDGQPENQIVQLTDSMGADSGRLTGAWAAGQGFRTLLSLPNTFATTTEASSTSGPTTSSTQSSETSAMHANAQDLSSFAGKVLRVSGFSKPLPANLSACRPVCAFAFGIRNSFGFAFHLNTGNSWQTENGPQCNDELNRIVKDGNHAWGPNATCMRDTAPGHEPGLTLSPNPAPLHLQSGHRPDWKPPSARGAVSERRWKDVFSSATRTWRRDPRCNTDRGPARGRIADSDPRPAERHPRRGARIRRSRLLQRRKRDLPAHGPLADASAARLARRNGASRRPRLHAPAAGARSWHGRGRRPAGITFFDTARAYGDNENLLGTRLSARQRSHTARIVTKGGMKPAEGRWIPDGRAKTIRADCEASLAALDGLEIDLYLIHAPDPGTAWKTTVRALARLADEGLVKHVGVANVNLRQFNEAVELPGRRSPGRAQRVRRQRRSRRSGRALRRGGAGRHRPLASRRSAPSRPRRSRRPGRGGTRLAPRALSRRAAIPGARTPETARSAARAAQLRLERRRPGGARQGSPRSSRQVPRGDGDIVVVIGIPGAGKSRVAEEYTARGYVRLNRDERGGTLRDIAAALDEQLASGVRRVVLDNTYLTRATRSYAIEVAAQHGNAARCIWLETPLAQAQVNLVERLLERFGPLPSPEELQKLANASWACSRRPHRCGRSESSSRRTPTRASPASSASRSYARRRPGGQEFRSGFGSGRVRLGERHRSRRTNLIFDWSPDGTSPVETPTSITGPAEVAVCVHGGGPPVCWCRPPLPGLPLAFARAHGVDPARSTLIGTSPATRRWRRRSAHATSPSDQPATRARPRPRRVVVACRSRP